MKKDRSRKYSSSEIWGYHEDTASELKLQRALRKIGVPFEREVPIKQFTVDFLVGDWLIVEVDGESHLMSHRQKRDKERQKVLEDTGYTVVRIPAMDLSNNSGLKQWANKIKNLEKQGPVSFTKQGFDNAHFKEQVESAKRQLEHARRIGLAEQKRRSQEAQEYSSQFDEQRKPSGKIETMDDYFGSDADDFQKYLDDYDWSKAPAKDEPERKQSTKGRRKR